MKSKKSLVLLLVCWLSVLSFTLVAQSDDLRSQAERALEQGDFKVAGNLIEQLAATEGVSADLYLTQGNAYFQSGDLGRAILAYERGLRLKPGNKTLKNNLTFVESKLEQQLKDLPGFFLQRWWKWTGSQIGPGVSSVLAIIFWWAAIGLFGFWFFKREEISDRRRFLLLPLSVAGLLLAITFYSLGKSRIAELEREDLAVLVAPQAELRVAPGKEATQEKTLTAGLRLRIVDTFKGEYVKVVLRDGKQGWLPVEAVEVI